MAITPSIEVSQGRTLSTGQVTNNIEVSQGRTNVTAIINGPIQVSLARSLAVYNFPTPSMELSQARVLSTGQVNNVIEVSQARTLAVVRGRVYNPKLRAWTFRLDSHEFYVLRLADEKTLVYDMTAGQWYWWSSEDFNYWRLNIGMNWRSPGQNSFNFGSNIVAGDHAFGLLWFLDPEQGYDDDPTGGGIFYTFPRVATGQMIARSRNYVGCYEVFLTASGGFPALTGSQVTLEYSDDVGNTYVNAGSLVATAGNYNQEFAWRSLGKFGAPGRLFRITDNGAFPRIDGLDINDGSGPTAA